MPVLPDPNQNFIHALSDFWSVFFKDTAQIQSYYKGVEVNIGQLYLELLETVLGSSLRNAPVFSKQYFKQFTVSEDALFFQEGSGLDADRYVFKPASDALVDAPALMNRVIEPTRVMEKTRDYEVVDASLAFHQNVFDIDGNDTALPAFPVRNVVKLFPAVYRDLLRRSWKSAGVRVGDFLRLRLLGGTPFDSRITGVREDTLLLETTHPEFATTLSRRSFSVSALRKPFDAAKRGLPLAEHPDSVARLSENETDVTLVGGTATVFFGTEPYYKGLWAAGTVYAAGDVVTTGHLPTFGLVRALVAHTAGAVYAAENWQDLTTCYFYLHHPDDVSNDALYSVQSVSPTSLELDTATRFASAGSMRALVYLVAFPDGLIGSPKPLVSLANTNLDAGSLTVAARRKHPVYNLGDAEGSPTYPANEAVIEGVDYTVDYQAGTLRILSGWDPLFLSRASYTWVQTLVDYTHAYRGAWSNTATYAVGDMVDYTDGKPYVARTGLTPFLATDWTRITGPFSFDQTYSVREMPFWGSDVLLDRETLYTNFGYLLAYKHPSSEQYRAFLRGVAQLFVLGPTIERFESALNVMAGLPVVRDDGEVLLDYNDGIAFSGSDGELIDADEGRDGILTTSGSSFSASTATFFPSDVGALLRVKIGQAYKSFLITAFSNTTHVVVSPAPPNGVNLVWSVQHVELTRRFRTASYAFTDADKGALVIITGAAYARNNGFFRIESVENPSTVILETEYGFTDEASLSWKLSRAASQSVVTTRATYEIPLAVPVRADIALPASAYSLTFQAFDTLTDAFHVTDYLQDPTWWHNVQIPEALAKFSAQGARRQASPGLIEHRLNPLDQALIGDFGLRVGADDEGRQGISRSGSATWYGGVALVLGFEVGTPGPRARDVGAYATVVGPKFRAQFQITGVDSATSTIRLRDFPPPELRATLPPVELSVTLSPLVYRRTVGFVMMDRFLKYHALRIEVDPGTPLSPSFIGEATQLLKEAKPAFTHVYLESPLDFIDRMLVDDTGLTVGVGLPLTEHLLPADNTLRSGPPGLLLAGDAYRFATFAQTIPSAVGTYPLTPTLPIGTNVRFHAVKGWFNLATTVGGRRLAEGSDYTFDRELGVVTVLSPLPAATAFNYVAVFLVTRTPGTLDQSVGETLLCVNGADPTTWWAATQTPAGAGLIDRAVQLTIGP